MSNKIKKDFPVFKDLSLVFLDNAASTQKPLYVLDGVKNFYSNSYANIHRGVYDLSHRAEKSYDQSKEKVAKLINASRKEEIAYTYNSTYALNLITTSLIRLNKLQSWDKVLLSTVEHHSNIVPWLILADIYWIEIDYINIDNDYNLDFSDFEKKYDSSVKVVSITYTSNVTWTIFDLNRLSKKLRNDTLFIVDGSQAVPNFEVDVQELDCDFMFFTGHKMMAETGIWVLYWKTETTKSLSSPISGWGAINWVKSDSFSEAHFPHNFEPWTPNLWWAVSLLKAIEYLESIWGYQAIKKNEEELIKYTLEEFNKIKWLKLIWSQGIENRIWVFSFYIPWIHVNDINDILAENNICIRSGHHCAEPFMNSLEITWTCRLSLYIYNDKNDIDRFFECLNNAIKILS